jgi:hypothetical protein
MRRLIAVSSLLLIGAAPPSPDAKLRAIIAPVSSARMKATIEKLVSFGTRHTLSSQTDPKRGIGAALSWSQGQFESLGLPTVRPCDTFTGDRIPRPTRVCDMVAIQRGTERPNDVVIITGHIDSRVTDPLNATSDARAPMTTVRVQPRSSRPRDVLSKHKFPGTMSYSARFGRGAGPVRRQGHCAYAKAPGLERHRGPQ